MKYFNNQTYLTEEEAAHRLDMSTDDMWLLMLEGGRPAHRIDDGEVLYLEAGIESIRSAVRS
jgi:hypothetical protein